MALSPSVLQEPETAPHRGILWDRGLSVPCAHTGPSSSPRASTGGQSRAGTEGSGRFQNRLFPSGLRLQQQEAKENKRRERSGTGGTCASGSCKSSDVL